MAKSNLRAVMVCDGKYDREVSRLANTIASMTVNNVDHAVAVDAFAGGAFVLGFNKVESISSDGARLGDGLRQHISREDMDALLDGRKKLYIMSDEDMIAHVGGILAK